MNLGVFSENIANTSESNPPTNTPHEKPTANATSLSDARRLRRRNIDPAHTNATSVEKRIDVASTRESPPMTTKLATPTPDAPR